MKIQSRRWALAAVTAALVVAGCSPGDKSEPGDAAPPKPAADSIVRIKDKGVTAKGGTVDVLNSVDWVSLDPANNYTIDSSEIGRLIYRTLTFIKDTPGEELSVQPDLAESLGTSSDGGKTWTYKLREGVKYEDGKPITAADVKYGVQRSFAQDVYDEGATYMVDLLANETDYAGPYQAPEKDLTSVETPTTARWCSTSRDRNPMPTGSCRSCTRCRFPRPLTPKRPTLTARSRRVRTRSRNTRPTKRWCSSAMSSGIQLPTPIDRPIPTGFSSPPARPASPTGCSRRKVLTRTR